MFVFFSLAGQKNTHYVNEAWQSHWIANWLPSLFWFQCFSLLGMWAAIIVWNQREVCSEDNMSPDRRLYTVGFTYIYQQVNFWFIISLALLSGVSLTPTEASMSHTSSADVPRGKPGPGRPGRWGSGSELSRVAGRRSDWMAGGATPAPSMPGSDSLETEVSAC